MVNLTKRKHKPFQWCSKWGVDIHFLGMGPDIRGLIRGLSEYYAALLPARLVTYILLSVLCLICAAFLNLCWPSPLLNCLISDKYNHNDSVHAQLNRTAMIWYVEPLWSPRFAISYVVPCSLFIYCHYLLLWSQSGAGLVPSA